MRIRSALAGVHLNGDSFGKLPEAGDLYRAYTQHADEVREIVAQLPGQITQVAQSLHDTASSYHDLDSDMADGIRRMLGPGVEVGGGLQGAAEAGDYSRFVDICASTQICYGDWTSGSERPMPPLTKPPGDGGGLDGLLDEAINWVISHVPELPKLLDDVTGDTAALEAAAMTWHDQGTALNAVIGDLRQGAADLPAEWAGDASESFGVFMYYVIQGLSELAGVMGQTQQILQEAADAAATAHNFIVSIIRDIAEWVVGQLIADFFTAGLAQLADSPKVAEWLAAKAGEGVEEAGRLARFYKGLKEALEAAKTVRQGYDEASGLGKLLKFTRLASDFMKEGKIWKEGGMLGLRGAIEAGNGKTLDWAAKHAIGEVMGKASLEGVGLKGAALHEGKVVGEAAAKDALEGKIRQEENDLGRTLGIESPPIPQAPTASRIEAQLNGTKPPAGPAPGSSPEPRPSPSPEPGAAPSPEPEGP
ncbi:MAG: WXG100 family type VII secretion target [Nocardiopsaceae bacterium]|nr:WXG100 family type VII secretion target [Nocardiopsaceae bacterium]